MLSIGRALMSQAKLLLIDEPSTGLAPLIKQDLFERIRDVHGLGITILLVEQDIGFAFNLADRNYVMSQGKLIAEGSSKNLLADDIIRRTYLGFSQKLMTRIRSIPGSSGNSQHIVSINSISRVIFF